MTRYGQKDTKRFKKLGAIPVPQLEKLTNNLKLYRTVKGISFGMLCYNVVLPVEKFQILN